MKKYISGFAIAFICFGSVIAQERPYRIGVKFFWPQTAGLNLEVVNKRASVDLNLSYFTKSINDASTLSMNWSVGGNCYLDKDGEDFYGGIGFGQYMFGIYADAANPAAPLIKEKASTRLDINTLNIRLGGKHGNGFYFQWEVGYEVAINKADIIATKTLSDGYNWSKKYDYPEKIGGWFGDLGVGIAF